MTEKELIRRTKQFGLRVLRLVEALPSSVGGRALAGQLVRAGTAAGANYRAACKGRSKAEFIAKLGVVEEEADECSYWLELIVEGGFMPGSRVKDLMAEAEALTRIMAASRLSAMRGSSRSIASRKSQVEN